MPQTNILIEKNNSNRQKIFNNISLDGRRKLKLISFIGLSMEKKERKESPHRYIDMNALTKVQSYLE